MDVSLLLPCKGRPEQTAALLPRLKETAGEGVRFELICIIDGPDEALTEAVREAAPWATVLVLPERRGYWKALSAGSQHATGRLLSHIANDVLPGREWLLRAVRAHDQTFPNGGVVGYNDGILFEEHTGHLLVDRGVLHRYYGDALWPVCYDHLFGDTELCRRAMAEGIYAINYKAVLFHNHFVLGLPQDEVYRFSHTHFEADRALFHRRAAAGWPPL